MRRTLDRSTKRCVAGPLARPRPLRPTPCPSRSGDPPMATAAASQQTVKGLDLGTSRIVLGTLNGQKVDFTPQLNAFVAMPYSKMTEQMLAPEDILHEVEGGYIYAY